ncbi:MAG TPA: thioredoxin-disulfide reductase [Phycisphaerae bacterium]|nr:thioredoxin-disulfide reductase [Phycisphaerae bacterium]HOI55479.1 thioredoxin-disulfide reductase [Phycisphaerae bacterium]
MKTYDVVILGSGPAGGTAAIYAARAHLTTALVTGPVPGGLPSTTHLIENFPGFPEGVEGPKMGMLVEQQARRFGAEFLFDIVESVDLSAWPFRMKMQQDDLAAKALIIATGSSPRRMGIPAEKEFEHRGVSTCATCDGRFFEGKPVAVVGGGDSALEEAVYLARMASKVTVIHRRDALRGGPVLQQRARENPKIDFAWNAVVANLKGDQAGLRQVVLKDTRDGTTRTLDVQGLFVAIGHTPNTELFKPAAGAPGPALQLDEQGYIVTDKRTRTNIEGVFAAGDVADPHFRQAITAAGTGCAAAIEATRYLESLG